MLHVCIAANNDSLAQALQTSLSDAIASFYGTALHLAHRDVQDALWRLVGEKSSLANEERYLEASTTC
jgi:hypothetical protein